MTKRTVRARAEKAAERVSRLKRGARSAVVAEASSGNVFADISVRNPEEALVRAKLMSEVMRILRYQKLTQVEAAHRLGIDQPKVSALLNGRMHIFSTARLLRYLNRLGMDVDIVVRPRPRGPGQLKERLGG
jgi:predicted XRE-type DNA-binding protein